MLPCKLEFRLSGASIKRSVASSYSVRNIREGEEDRGSYRVIFKVGNDLRQDQGERNSKILQKCSLRRI